MRQSIRYITEREKLSERKEISEIIKAEKTSRDNEKKYQVYHRKENLLQSRDIRTYQSRENIQR